MEANYVLCLCLACSTTATHMGASASNAFDRIGVIVCMMTVWSAALPFLLTVAGPQGIHGAVVFCGAKLCVCGWLHAHAQVVVVSSVGMLTTHRRMLLRSCLAAVSEAAQRRKAIVC